LYQLAERCEISSGMTKVELLNGVLIEKAHNTEDLLESLVSSTVNLKLIDMIYPLILVETTSKNVY
jgi:hypothetical protein